MCLNFSVRVTEDLRQVIKIENYKETFKHGETRDFPSFHGDDSVPSFLWWRYLFSAWFAPYCYCARATMHTFSLSIYIYTQYIQYIQYMHHSYVCEQYLHKTLSQMPNHYCTRPIRRMRRQSMLKVAWLLFSIKAIRTTKICAVCCRWKFILRLFYSFTFTFQISYRLYISYQLSSFSYFLKSRLGLLLLWLLCLEKYFSILSDVYSVLPCSWF